MPHIKANNIQIYYEVTGEGPPLLLLSGFAQNHTCWQGISPHLSKHFRVYALDNRGAGQTDAPEESYSIELFAQDTIALMDALNLPSAHLMGVSMGTLIAQALCLHYPERIGKVVLCAPFSNLPPITKHNIETQIALLSAGISKRMLTKLNMSWLFSNTFMRDPKNIEQFLQELAADPYPMTIEGLLGQTDALLSADFESQLPGIAHQTLLLVGEEDIDTPLSLAQVMQEKIPSCEMHVFEKMAHMFPYEMPKKTAEKALAFLNQ